MAADQREMKEGSLYSFIALTLKMEDTMLGMVYVGS